MLKTALKTFVGSRHKREAKKLQPLVSEINSFFEGLSSLSDEELKSKTTEFRGYIAARTAQLKTEISERREEKRHSEDPSIENDYRSRSVNSKQTYMRNSKNASRTFSPRLLP